MSLRFLLTMFLDKATDISVNEVTGQDRVVVSLDSPECYFNLHITVDGVEAAERLVSSLQEGISLVKRMREVA